MTQQHVSISTVEQLIASAQWDQYRQFLNIVDEQLANFTQNWEEELNRMSQQLEERQKDEFYDFYFGELHVMQQHEALLMNSFFVASFSLLEFQLTRLCNRIQQRLQSPFSVDDLKGSNAITDRAKLYTTKLGIPFPKDTPEWASIKEYQAIRNRITHNGGYVAPNWKHFDSARTKGIVVSKWDEHRLELAKIFVTKHSTTSECSCLKPFSPPIKGRLSSYWGPSLYGRRRTGSHAETASSDGCRPWSGGLGGCGLLGGVRASHR